MPALRRLSRRLSWIAFLAIFGLALVPTLSRALAGLGVSSGWVEICTLQGTRWVAPGEPAPPAVVGHLDHCPLCGLAASTPPLAQAFLALAPAAAETKRFQTADSQRRSRLRPWSAAQARAPPRFG